MLSLADLFPAHAGVILIIIPPLAAILPVPRTRGGDPNGYAITSGDNHCSPHTRG